MKRNLPILLLIALLGTLLLSACNSGPSGTEITGADKDAVLKYAEPATDSILNGYNAGDYAAFSRDFNDTMLSGLNEKAFGDTRTKIMSAAGAYKSRTVDKVMDYGNAISVIYKGTFEKAPLQVLVSFEKSAPHKVSGLYFK